MSGFDDEVLAAGRIRAEVDGALVTVTLTRPEIRNAQIPATWEALAHVGSTLPADTRVVVVRGEGPSFSAGLDRSAFAGESVLGTVVSAPQAVADTLIENFQAGFRWLSDPGVISIAAVQGHAVGAGFQLALACDLVVAADDASFRMAEIGLGLIPDLTGTARLVRAVGEMRALELCATGRPVGAAEAAALGLALQVVPAAELSSAVDTLVGTLLAQDPQALSAVSRLFAEARLRPSAEQAAVERTEQLPLLRGMAARLAGS